MLAYERTHVCFCSLYLCSYCYTTDISLWTWPRPSPRPVVAYLQRRNFGDARHIALQALLLTTRNGATPFTSYNIQ